MTKEEYHFIKLSSFSLSAGYVVICYKLLGKTFAIQCLRSLPETKTNTNIDRESTFILKKKKNLKTAVGALIKSDARTPFRSSVILHSYLPVNSEWRHRICYIVSVTKRS